LRSLKYKNSTPSEQAHQSHFIFKSAFSPHIQIGANNGQESKWEIQNKTRFWPREMACKFGRGEHHPENSQKSIIYAMNNKSNEKFRLIVAIASFLGISAPCQTILYSQPYATYTGSPADALPEYDVYDDFKLGAGGTVNQVTWTGFLNISFSVGSFNLAFWSNQEGLPGTLLLSETIMGNANQTFVSTAPDNQFTDINNYSTTLTTPFQAAPGTDYYLSIQAGNGGWGWGGSTTGDSGILQFAYDYSSYTHYLSPAGTAFTLIEVPEPGTASLIGLGCAAISLIGVYRVFSLKMILKDN
jgi:hypothetical protein